MTDHIQIGRAGALTETRQITTESLRARTLYATTAQKTWMRSGRRVIHEVATTQQTNTPKHFIMTSRKSTRRTGANCRMHIVQFRSPRGVLRSIIAWRADEKHDKGPTSACVETGIRLEPCCIRDFNNHDFQMWRFFSLETRFVSRKLVGGTASLLHL